MKKKINQKTKKKGHFNHFSTINKNKESSRYTHEELVQRSVLVKGIDINTIVSYSITHSHKFSKIHMWIHEMGEISRVIPVEGSIVGVLIEFEKGFNSNAVTESEYKPCFFVSLRAVLNGRCYIEVIHPSPFSIEDSYERIAPMLSPEISNLMEYAQLQESVMKEEQLLKTEVEELRYQLRYKVLPKYQNEEDSDDEDSEQAQSIRKWKENLVRVTQIREFNIKQSQQKIMSLSDQLQNTPYIKTQIDAAFLQLSMENVKVIQSPSLEKDLIQNITVLVQKFMSYFHK
eukprot:c19595_g1_i2.p1 GENE.c19595_g1_i2~~c19595_g1_i2.p1  ORF type:complete len:288 (+),score=82.30 c19595_g1_i2:40-903(+)